MAHEIRVLDGFNRTKEVTKKDTATVKLKNRVGGVQGGTTLQGFNRILQGYAMNGTKEDLEEWEFLVNIEHPATLQGYEQFILDSHESLNGRKERQERRRRRRARRKARRQARRQKRAKRQRAREKKRASRKSRRQERQEARHRRREKRRDLRVARKEERLQRRQQRREQRQLNKEARRERKARRIEARQERQKLRQEGKTARQELKTERGANIGAQLQQFGQSALPAVAELIGGGGDATISDYAPGQLPGDFEGLVSDLQNMPYEDALDYREDMLDEDEFLDYRGMDDDDDSGTSMVVPLAIGAGALLLMSQSKGKKKKK